MQTHSKDLAAAVAGPSKDPTAKRFRARAPRKPWTSAWSETKARKNRERRARSIRHIRHLAEGVSCVQASICWAWQCSSPSRRGPDSETSDPKPSFGFYKEGKGGRAQGHKGTPCGSRPEERCAAPQLLRSHLQGIKAAALHADARQELAKMLEKAAEERGAASGERAARRMPPLCVLKGLISLKPYKLSQLRAFRFFPLRSAPAGAGLWRGV